MTEMLAALLGALVGGLLSAGVGTWQTGKVLKHETEMAAAERREATRADEERRQVAAADYLIAALADYVALDFGARDRAAHFVRMMATSDVHRDRERRSTALLQAGASYAHALPEEVQERWHAQIWMVRFAALDRPERPEQKRWRDYSDLMNYTEYVRRSLCAVSEDYPMPPRFPAPDLRREEDRIWGYRPDGRNEPDLTDWQLSSDWVGEVTFSSGERRWYGPNGLVEDLPPRAPETSERDD